MATLFISDLHLSAERPAIAELFLRFLRERAVHADALYILGDLFEYWIGDDAAKLSGYLPVMDGLRALAGTGTPVYLMHGNRDFLLDGRFEQATGTRLLPDPSIIDLYGQAVLLMHGDTLCTDDVEYQTFRATVRNPAWIGRFVAKGLAERQAIVRSLRESSKAATAAKKPEIMDVNQGAVEAAMTTHCVRRLIHGHTHRPGLHEFQLGGEKAYRTVLGDWYDRGSVLVCTEKSCILEQLG
ncbi:MAG: UDP-2,3-diacylglucosamine diphosphatase [Gammaproteobacteria bacterium]|nr:UDP-2,3-diacylglucosamine diphosphatase [Gammaproteobacteria bacterium]